MWSVIETGAVFGGLGLLAIIVGAIVLVCVRESNGKPVLPWSARMRVERAKAHTEVLQQQLAQEAIEVKRLAVDHQRTRVMDAAKDNDHDAVMRLGLPSGDPHRPLA